MRAELMPRVCILCPMARRLVDGRETFTGDQWVGAMSEVDYPRDKIQAVILLDGVRFMPDLPFPWATIPHTSDRHLDRRETRRLDARARGEPPYQRFVDVRNLLLDRGLLTDADLFWSVDSDVLVRPGCLQALLDVNLPMVGAPVPNNRRPKRLFPDGLWDQWSFGGWHTLDSDPAKSLATPCESLPHRGLHEVGYAGAATLFTRQVAEITNYASHRQGEDIPFCHTLAKHKIPIHVLVDHQTECVHLMHPDLWEYDLEQWHKEKD